MKPKRRTNAALVSFVCLVMLILTTLFAPACTPAQHPRIGFNPVLSISEPPALGKPVTIKLTFTTAIPKGLEDKKLSYWAHIELAPGGYEIIDNKGLAVREGNKLELQGNLDKAGETITLEATIKSIRIGDGLIYSQVNLVIDGELDGSEIKELYIQINQDGAMVSQGPFSDDWVRPVLTVALILIVCSIGGALFHILKKRRNK